MADFPGLIALPLVALAGIAIVKMLPFLETRVSFLKLNKKGAVMKAEMDVDEAEDRISLLPDDVLCSIIQRLGLRDGVRTSILSRRWKSLCATIPNIKFCCLEMLGNEELNVNFHNPMLQERDKKRFQQYMLKFSGSMGRPNMQLTAKHIAHLKEVEYWGFQGTDNEIELALYILRGVVVLGRLTLHRFARYYWGDGRWFRRNQYPWSEETWKRIRERIILFMRDILSMFSVPYLLFQITTF